MKIALDCRLAQMLRSDVPSTSGATYSSAEASFCQLMIWPCFFKASTYTALCAESVLTETQENAHARHHGHGLSQNVSG